MPLAGDIPVGVPGHADLLTWVGGGEQSKKPGASPYVESFVGRVNRRRQR